MGENTITINGSFLSSPLVLENVYTVGGGSDTFLGIDYTYVYQNRVKIGFLYHSEEGGSYFQLFLGERAKYDAAVLKYYFGLDINVEGIPDFPSLVAP